MEPQVVVDVGNTQMKWGRCAMEGVTHVVRLASNDPEAWDRQRDVWDLPSRSTWVVSGVHPKNRDRFSTWLDQQGEQVRVLRDPEEIPIRTHLEHPEYVGIDRLLDAVAANARRRPKTPAAMIDAGSAVTVDFLDGEGVFAGGAIFPGFGLMAKSLNDYTALLPLVKVETPPSNIGTDTLMAMRVGIFWTIVGGIERLLRLYRHQQETDIDVFLTGGDGQLLATRLDEQFQLWPEMTLEGIRLSVA